MAQCVLPKHFNWGRHHALEVIANVYVLRIKHQRERSSCIKAIKRSPFTKTTTCPKPICPYWSWCPWKLAAYQRYSDFRRPDANKAAKIRSNNSRSAKNKIGCRYLGCSDIGWLLPSAVICAVQANVASYLQPLPVPSDARGELSWQDVKARSLWAVFARFNQGESWNAAYHADFVWGN